MKAIGVLTVSLAAGVTTFAAEHYLFPPQLHAAPFVVPEGPGWRQQMIDEDPGGAVVDRRLEHLADRLDLTDRQEQMLRPLLENEHERILALLLTAPKSLTRANFLTERQAIRNQTHQLMDRLLSPEQRQLMQNDRRLPTA